MKYLDNIFTEKMEEIGECSFLDGQLTRRRLLSSIIRNPRRVSAGQQPRDKYSRVRRTKWVHLGGPGHTTVPIPYFFCRKRSSFWPLFSSLFLCWVGLGRANGLGSYSERNFFCGWALTLDRKKCPKRQICVRSRIPFSSKKKKIFGNCSSGKGYLCHPLTSPPPFPILHTQKSVPCTQKYVFVLCLIWFPP